MVGVQQMAASKDKKGGGVVDTWLYVWKVNIAVFINLLQHTYLKFQFWCF